MRSRSRSKNRSMVMVRTPSVRTSSRGRNWVGKVRQNTGASFASTEISSILNAVTLNYESPVVRYSATFTDVNVACVKPFSSSALNFANYRAATQSFVEAAMYPPARQLVAHSFRNPLRATVTYNPNTDAAGTGFLSWSYFAQFTQRNAGQPLSASNKFQILWSDPTPAPHIVGALDSAIPVTPTSWSSISSSYSPHGPVLYCGICDGLVGTWMDAYDAPTSGTLLPTKCSFTFYPSITLAAALNVTVMVFRCLGDKWDPSTSLDVSIPIGTTSAGYTFDWLVKAPGYYHFTVQAHSNPCALSMEIITTGNCPCYEHKPITRIEDFRNIISQARVTAVSSLITFASSNVINGGLSTSIQSRGDVPWITLNGYDVIAVKPNANNIPWKLGLYGYLKPSKVEDFNYYDVFVNEGGMLIDAYYPIIPSGDYITQCVVIPDGSTTVNPGFGRIRPCHTIEFPVDTPWVEASLPTITAAHYTLAMSHIRHADQFFENSNHIRSLKAAISRIIPMILGGNINVGRVLDIGEKVYRSARAAHQAWG